VCGSISGLPVTKGGKLVGIVRFETRFDAPISDVMTKENLVTVPVGATLEQAKSILHRRRVENRCGSRPLQPEVRDRR
jgi:IMP dehydrogenase